MEQPGKLIVAGGGTGGHVLAGIAIADAWKARSGREVFFVGASGGIEEKLVPRAHYPLYLLKIGSLKRTGWKKVMRTLLLLPLALLQSLSIVLRVRPQAVIGVGGYASGPLVLVAGLLRPFLRHRTAILEQNSVPGLTNRSLSRFSDVIFAAFPGTEREFSMRRRVILSGNPVRQGFRPMPPAARKPFVIFIFGGSQGAIGINSLVLEALPHLQGMEEQVEFIHQTGMADLTRVKEGYSRHRFRFRVEPFIYEMEDAYRRSSLVICRSGSSTLAELAAVRRAAVLIPFPGATDGHQEKNARVFAEAGAAVVLLQAETSGAELAGRIRTFVENPSKIGEIEEKVACFYRPDAAQEIINELIR